MANSPRVFFDIAELGHLTFGRIVIEFFANTNPLTAENFLATTHPRHWSRSRLVWRGYYSGKRFWRRMDLRRWVPGSTTGSRYPLNGQSCWTTKQISVPPPHEGGPGLRRRTAARRVRKSCEWVWCDQARWADGRKWICSLLCQCQSLSAVRFFPEYVCVNNGRLVRVHFRLCPGNLWEVVESVASCATEDGGDGDSTGKAEDCIWKWIWQSRGTEALAMAT